MADLISPILARLLATPTPPELGPGPRAGVQTVAAIDRALAEWSAPTSASRRNLELVRALILLWHDHLDESHTISQSIEDGDGAFVHGIMHRREPDYGNAAYWFRRVGQHPAFPEIAARVSALINTPELAKLIPNGRWDPFAFIHACETSPGSLLLRDVQAIETAVLLERFSC